MFERDILVKGSPGTSSFKDSEAHITKTRFGSCSVSNYIDTKDSGIGRASLAGALSQVQN